RTWDFAYGPAFGAVSGPHASLRPASPDGLAPAPTGESRSRPRRRSAAKQRRRAGRRRSAAADGARTAGSSLIVTGSAHSQARRRATGAPRSTAVTRIVSKSRRVRWIDVFRDLIQAGDELSGSGS